jgi:hypothetical protein
MVNIEMIGMHKQAGKKAAFLLLDPNNSQV